MTFQGYGGYQQPPQVSPEIQNIFQIVDKDRSGRINALELKTCLVNGRGENFSDTACNLMVGECKYINQPISPYLQLFYVHASPASF
jgi:hypothetical protein